MGLRGEHLRSEAGSDRYEREERESLAKLAEVMREDEMAEAMAWASRLAEGRSLRDQTRAVVLHHVKRLAERVNFLERENTALRKNATTREADLTRRMKKVRDDLSKSREYSRNLLRYRTDCQKTA